MSDELKSAIAKYKTHVKSLSGKSRAATDKYVADTISAVVELDPEAVREHGVHTLLGGWGRDLPKAGATGKYNTTIGVTTADEGTSGEAKCPHCFRDIKLSLHT
jgi:hypothetical protein